MNLKELKQKTPADLLSYAEELEIENASTMRKQDIMFAILKQLALETMIGHVEYMESFRLVRLYTKGSA